MSVNKNYTDLTPLLWAYREAHETRRKWEHYIWQWGVLLTVLAALIVAASNSEFEFTIFHKLIMPVLTGFIFAIFYNVLRARVLMKEIEKTIHKMHIELKLSNFKIVPFELNEGLSKIDKFSSTKIVLVFHFIAAIVFLVATIYMWIRN